MGEREMNSIRCETFDLERNSGIHVCASKGWRKEGLEDWCPSSICKFSLMMNKLGMFLSIVVCAFV
jgi:hypothetical protein